MSADTQTSEAVRAAHNAAEAIRAVNHATTLWEPGLRWPSDVYEELGALATLAERLPQALTQLAAFLDRELQAEHIHVDVGEFVGDPLAAVSAADHYIERATALATQLAETLAHAHSATSGFSAGHKDDASS